MSSQYSRPSFSADDHRFMARALQLAEKGLYTTAPNPRVGCVLVQGEQIVGEGFHQRAGEAHAEVHALRDAGDRASGATAYVTLEPCSHTGKTPPCSQALIDAGVKRVVAAMQDPNPLVAGQGLDQLKQAGIEVSNGLMEDLATQLNRGFVKRMSTGLPWVCSKLAMGIDARTAMASGESQWISGAESREDVQRLRARSSAILTGIGTVLADDPSMNVRASASVLSQGRDRLCAGVPQPMRVVLDARLEMPVDAKMLTLPGDTLIVCNETADSSRRDALQAAGAEVLQMPSQGRIPLSELLQALALREINEVLVEAGAVLNGALLDQGLIDELIVYVAPHVMGDAARGLFHVPGLDAMKQRIEFEYADVARVGRDLRLTLRPVNQLSEDH